MVMIDEDELQWRHTAVQQLYTSDNIHDNMFNSCSVTLLQLLANVF